MDNPEIPREQWQSELRQRRVIRIPGRRKLIRAAVAVVVSQREAGESVLMVKRAVRAGDPWSGDVGFPGGRLHSTDAGGGAAACRETFEETGLVLSQSQRIARLHDRITRAHRQPLPMVVSPFVYQYPGQRSGQKIDWRLNHEVDAILWVPLAFLAASENRKKMRWRLGPATLRLPCYHYQGYRIWGLSLLMLDELVRIYRG